MLRVLLFTLCLAMLAFAQETTTEAPLPENFDAREKWPECQTPILNQGHCGSCWAFSSQRLCIASKGKIPADYVMSPQYLVSCDKDGQNGCRGGDTLAAYNFIHVKGIDGLNCTKYIEKDEVCPSKCEDGSAIDSTKLFFGSEHYSLLKGTTEETVKAIQRDLYENGPLSMSFVVYKDFMTFFKSNPKGIYNTTGKGVLGGHAVRLVGWGKDQESGMEYWTIANSWGTAFAHDGYFKVKRGVNLATFESRRVSAGKPKVDGESKTKVELYDYEPVIDGAPTKIAVNEEIIEIAKYSLAQMHRKRMPNAPKEFYGVEEAYTQVTNGITYHLTLSTGANEDAAPASTNVVIHQDVHNNLVLKSH